MSAGYLITYGKNGYKVTDIGRAVGNMTSMGDSEHAEETFTESQLPKPKSLPTETKITAASLNQRIPLEEISESPTQELLPVNRSEKKKVLIQTQLKS